MSPLALPVPPPAASPPVLILRPRDRWRWSELTVLLRYRDLLWHLALRDVQVRYKQTVLGAAWAVLQPVLTMVVLSVVFGRFMGLEERTGGVPYPVFLFAGLVPWTFFAASVQASSQSLVANANLIKKIYFPRLIVPVASVGAPLVDYALSMAVLLAMMAWFGVPLTWRLVLLPVMLASTVVAALGVGVLLSALTAVYRDFRYVVAFLVQVWFFVTPVIYPVSVVPARYAAWLALNPMHGTIEAFRAVALGNSIDWSAFAVSSAVAVACLAAGIFYFHGAERRLADVL